MGINFTKTSRYLLFFSCFIAGLDSQAQDKTSPSPADSAHLKPVNLIYLKVPRALTTTSTSVVAGSDLVNLPVTNYPAALAGRLAGLNVGQTSGSPFAEGFSMSLRGLPPLILVDGMARDVTQLTLEEIESVTVLKDAVATAMLGVRGSKGAVLVTTKKGYIGPQVISFTTQAAFQRPLNNLISNTLNAHDYATLYNEALVNDGRSLPEEGYSGAAIQAYKEGSNPYLYPDVNWRDEILNDQSLLLRYNLNTSGGNKNARYFVALEHINQEGHFKKDPANTYSTNQALKSYFIRSNIDLNLDSKLSAGLYAMGRISNSNRPGNDGTNTIFSSLLNTPNNAYPIYNPNGSYSGNRFYTNNIKAQSIASGYQDSYRRDVLVDFYLKRTLDDLLPGLWAKARASFYSQLMENITRNKTFATFQPNGTNASGAPIYIQYGTNGAQTGGAAANSVSLQNRSDFQEISVGYSHTFEDSGIDVTLLANRDNLVTGTQLPYTIQGISGYAGYNYQQKYLIELSFAANGSNRYEGGRNDHYPLFPAIGLGWNINKENFLSGTAWLNHLKLYGSYGKTGWDNAGYYIYRQAYNSLGQTVFYQFGSTATAPANSTLELGLAYPDITWEKSKKLNLGIQGAVLDNRLHFDVNYYNNLFYDVRRQRGMNNPILGIAYPDENIGRMRYSGLETELEWNVQKSGFNYFVAVNAALQDSKLLYFGEFDQAYPWMQATNQRVGQAFGYQADGLFSQAEISAGNVVTLEGYTPQAGDIKYKDLNGDKVINQFDRAPIGTNRPALLLGSSLGFSYAGFDFSMLLQGMLNRQVNLNGNSYWEFQTNSTYGQPGQAFEHHKDRWTPSNTDAAYPRLTTGGGPGNGANNNQVASSFWYRNGSYMRLRKLELGYSVPTKLASKIKMNSVRVFLSGFNMFTLASSDLNGADPENYTGLYPIQKLFNLGINVKF